MRILTTGNELCARAAVEAGCRFFAGYPITPASTIFACLVRDLPAKGGVAMSSPDEISALAYCIGASMRGVPSMTATSGPGWCLMIESVGYALMTETPVVIAVVQRLGPATGGATQGAQGDVGLVSEAVSGGYRFPIFSPSTAAECHEDTLRAFYWSERLRTPVVLLSDKEVASTSEVVETDDLSSLRPDPRSGFHGPPSDYRTYAFAAETDVPPFTPVGGPAKVTATGSAHDQAGNLRKNDPETLGVLRHLQAKIDAAEPELGRIDLDAQDGADTLVLAYGVSARASRDAVAAVRGAGGRVSLGVLRTLFPVPETALTAALRGVRRVVVPEENHGGTYRHVLAPWLAGREVIGVNDVGRLLRPEAIARAIGGGAHV